jgi:hypothetical protein
MPMAPTDDGSAIAYDDVGTGSPAVLLPHLHASVADAVLARYARKWEKIPRAYLAQALELVAAPLPAPPPGGHLPVVVVTGRHDALHSAHAGALLEAFPGARTVVVESGTEVPAEAPGELAEVLGQFVRHPHRWSPVGR